MDTRRPTSSRPPPGWRSAGRRSGSSGWGNRIIAEPASAGALPTLYAATSPGLRPDSFTGPGPLGWRGAPAPPWRAGWTRDDVTSERLWVASEQLTQVTYPDLAR